MTSPAVTLLARARELDENATKGPWKVWGSGVASTLSPAELGYAEFGDDETTCRIAEVEDFGTGLDAEFIAESRELLPKFRKAIEALMQDEPYQSTQLDAFWLGFNAMRQRMREIIERELGGGQ